MTHSARLLRRLAAALLLSWAGAAAAAVPATSPGLTVDNPEATAGFYRLNWQWEGEPHATYELQEAPTPRFAEPRKVYIGPDRARVMSGREDGRYHYRVRVWVNDEPVTPWSEPVTVHVDHHPLTRAFGFFALGAVVFVATAVVVVGGTRRARREAT